MPQDFYHRPLTAGLFFKLFLFGLLAACLCLPLASAMHAFGHAFFGMAGGCRWIGVLIPFEGHAQAIVNFPSVQFPIQAGFAWFALGGFLWVGLLLVAIAFFPTADALLQNLFFQVLGFHLAFWGLLKEAVVLWPAGEMALRSGGVPSAWTDPALWGPVAAGTALSALFAVRTVRIFGQGLHFTFFTPLFLSLALWFAPAAAALTALFILDGPAAAIAVLGGAALLGLLLSPLFGAGPRLWKEPSFTPWLYGLALAGAAAVLAAVFVFGWGPGAKPLLWGALADGAVGAPR